MRTDLEQFDTRVRSTAKPAQHRVRCDRLDLDTVLGRDRVVSAHRTSEGVVTYLRCHCGGLVIAGADGSMKHAHSAHPAA